MLTTLGFLIVWRFCWIPQKGNSRRNPLQESAAIVCTLVILFFAISLSDDLRADAILSDECLISRRHSTPANSRHDGSDTQHRINRFGSAMLIANPAIPSLQTVSRLPVVEPWQRKTLINQSPSSSRAPPFSS